VRKITKPTKKTFLQFIIFNFGGVMFFVIGYVTFVILYGLFHWAWLPAKILADFLGWTANFVIQYFWAFREEAKAQHAHKVTGKFTAVSIMNLGIDYAIVALLAWIGVSPFIGLIIAANFFTIWKWLWYKHYVFARKHHIPKPE
jgi:putative flippase GtrA